MKRLVRVLEKQKDLGDELFKIIKQKNEIILRLNRKTIFWGAENKKIKSRK